MTATLDNPVASPAPAKSALPVVCHVVHSLNVGGAERLATRLALRLAGECRTVFACLDDMGPLAADLADAGIPHRHLQRGGGIDWGCVRRLSAWLRERKVALVHAHQATPFNYTLLAGAIRRRPPLVFTEHGRFYPDRSSWKRRLLHRALLKKRDRIVAVGGAVRTALAEIERLPAEQTRVIYNGVPLAPAAQSARDGLRRMHDTNLDAFVVVMVARFDPIKNHALALAAWEPLARQLPAAQLWLVGDGPARRDIERLAAEQGLSSCVRFLGERRDVSTLLSAADAALLTSHSEGIPLVLIEAMAAGLPVVSTAVGGVPEIVTHGVQGLLAPPGDAAALSQHLLSLAQSRDLRRRLGRAGIVRSEDFHEDRMVAAYAELYREVLTP